MRRAGILAAMASFVRSFMDYTGMDGLPIGVECHITKGLPSVTIIGYASRAVNEAKDRLRAGFNNSALEFPKRRITVNLSPADTPKDSTALDLAMAISVLAAAEQIEADNLPDAVFMGGAGPRWVIKARTRADWLSADGQET